MSWADVLVQGQSQPETHVSPEEQNGHILGSEPAQVLLTTQHQGDLPPGTALHSKALSNQWYIKCVISKSLPMGWWHTSLCFCLCKHLCFVPLFLSFMFKFVPHISCSLAHIPSLAQTADNHILLLGRGESRHILLHAPRSVLGTKPLWQGPSAHASTQRRAGRLWRQPTAHKPALLPNAAPLHPRPLELVRFPVISSRYHPPTPRMPSSFEWCFLLQCTQLLAAAVAAASRCFQGWGSPRSALKPGQLTRCKAAWKPDVSGLGDLHRNLDTRENPHCSGSGREEGITFISLDQFSQAVASHLLNIA